MAEILGSSPQGSQAANTSDMMAVNGHTEANTMSFRSEVQVQVKSSNAEPEATSEAYEDDDVTDTDEEDLDKQPSSSSANVPAAEATPATSRPTGLAEQPTIKETPNTKSTLMNPVADTDDDDMGPFSTAPNGPRTASTSQTRTTAQLTSTINGTSESDSDGDLPVKKTPGRTYGKGHSARRKPQSNAPSSPTAHTSSDKDRPVKAAADEGRKETSSNGPAKDGDPAAFTSDPMDGPGAFVEAAKRSISTNPTKRKVSEDEEDGASSNVVVAKKRKTGPSGNTPMPVDSDGDEFLEDIKPVATKSKATRAKRSSVQGKSTEDISVAAPKSSGQPRSSPRVVIPTQRASTDKILASDTPSSTATSSALTEKPPKVLLSSESSLRKSASKWLKEQGSEIIDDVKTRRTHFVCVLKDDKLGTAKVLRSLALGKLVVTEEWVKESKKAGHFLEPEDFVHPKLKGTLGHDRKNLFHGKNLFFTSTLVTAVYGGTGWDEIQELVKEAGASSVEKGNSGTFGSSRGSNETICFGTSPDPDVGRLMSQYGCTVYSKSLLTHSILTGELDLEDDEYKLSAVGARKKR
ncbi:hypothetical protein LTR37_002494 [Vermiconidia calcicola]|uniref:Uncharacterized protein n=1 Tax=Vermiconidia calcicola TaxID=1690605 RepID=A0ACC3NT61_9PEZI|nr:hypothetical protein LTR37_002494 [Vermiconidia calcicola]